MADHQIRVKIRYHGEPSGKLLRFPKSMRLNPLIMMIAYKLLGAEGMSGFDASQHQLVLGSDDGGYIVDLASEIDDGDELVLQRVIINDDDDDDDNNITSPQRAGLIPPASATAARVTPSVEKKKQESSTDDKVQRKRNLEQTKFMDCEQKYLTIVDDWKYGVKNHNVQTITEIYVRLLDCVNNFSAPFIEAYGMPALMKQSKRIVDDENRSKLWKSMKDVYVKKKKEVPVGFVPQKASREVSKTEVTESSTAFPQRLGSMIPPNVAASSSVSVARVKKDEEQATEQDPIKLEPHESPEVISLLDDDDDDEKVLRPDGNTSQSNQTVDLGAIDDTAIVRPDRNTSQSNQTAGLVGARDDTVIRPDTNTSQSNQEAVRSGGRAAAGVKRKAEPIRRVQKKPSIITIDDDSDTDDESSRDGSIEDGSDAWMSPEEEEEDDESDFEPDSDDDGLNSEEEAEMQKIKGKAPKSPKESPLQVVMDEKDVPSAPGKREGKNDEDQEEEEVSLLVNGAGRQKTDTAVKARIMKLLNTGFHDQSNEHEAKNAMKLAQRLMRKHNLSQALLLKEREEKDNGNQKNNSKVLRGGMVHVKIFNRNTQKPALFARWLSDLAYHVGVNFDVKSYHTVRRGRKCEVTFYGIYTNTQLAGYAYRVAAERISQMGATYKPARNSYVRLASCRLSYCIGIVKGIGDEVEQNIREEKLKRLRKLERARLAVSQGEVYEESDDDEGIDGVDGANYSFPDPVAEDGAGGDDQMPSTTEQTVPFEMKSDGSSMATPPPVLSGEALDQRIKELEDENQAALVLVDHREKVAEDVLKDNGIEVGSARPRARINFHGESYRQGIEDSKEVDINQRAIRAEVNVKKEFKIE